MGNAAAGLFAEEGALAQIPEAASGEVLPPRRSRCAANAPSGGSLHETHSRHAKPSLPRKTVARIESVEASYDVAGKAIGVGAFGSVRKATHRLTRVVRAVKVVPRSSDKFVRAAAAEIEVLSVMDHPNIVKLHEVWEGPESFHLVMDLCSGGELFERVIEAGCFSEAQTAVAMQQLLRAVSYMHAHHVCHRDLKPENLLFQGHQAVEQNNLKIIDFGYATRFEPGEFLTRKVGTPDYVDPEILSGSYTHLCDVWSAGVIMYIMLSGSPPFYGDSNAAILQMVRSASFTFNLPNFSPVSHGAKALVRALLTKSSKRRLTAKQALSDRWLRGSLPRAGASSGVAGAGLLERLKQFHAAGRLKKAALHVIASQLGDEHIRCLQDAFVMLDKDCDGLLGPGELKRGLGHSGLAEGAEDLLGGVQAAFGGILDYTAFLTATLDERLTRREDICRTAFSALDRDGDGRLSRDELRIALGGGELGAPGGLGEEAVRDLLEEADENGDGVIDFEEFMKMMGGRAPTKIGRGA